LAADAPLPIRPEPPSLARQPRSLRLALGNLLSFEKFVPAGFLPLHGIYDFVPQDVLRTVSGFALHYQAFQLTDRDAFLISDAPFVIIKFPDY
jgi:hypothetical protein